MTELDDDYVLKLQLEQISYTEEYWQVLDTTIELNKEHEQLRNDAELARRVEQNVPPPANNNIAPLVEPVPIAKPKLNIAATEFKPQEEFKTINHPVNTHNLATIIQPRNCQMCNKEFVPPHNSFKYCSTTCFHQNRSGINNNNR